MPQDNLISAVYRSFITCDDPKGVVECRKIRKSKTDSQNMDGKIESQRSQKNLNTSSSFKEERKDMVRIGTTQEIQTPSSFQLMKVSRGVQKLNQVIDSWSKGTNFNEKSKDISKDLLRGALDLQESLVMLGTLQEASHYMAKLKKKQKQKDVGGRADQHSDRLGDHNYQMGYQKRRTSDDGSSKDCYEELVKVIRVSLARQNLLSTNSSDAKTCFDTRKLDLSPDIPSASSSQSSMVHSHDLASSDCSFSSRFPHEKPEGPSLIAKLMGLEEIPSKSLQSTTQNQSERDKIFYQGRSVFDIGMSKARKPQSVVQRVDWEHRTSEEIIESTQFKGLLKRMKHQTCHSNTSHLEKRFTDDAPQIVIIKPLFFPYPEAEELCTQSFTRKVRNLETEETPMKWRMKQVVPPKTIDHREGASKSEVRRKLQRELTPIKRFSEEKGAKDCKDVLAKPKDKEAKIKEKMASNKMKSYVPLNPKSHKEAIEKKVDKIQKAMPNRRKPVEMENVKSKGFSKSHDEKKLTSTKLKKPKIVSHISKNQILQPKNTSSNSTLKRTTTAISHISSVRKKKVKNQIPVSEPLSANVKNIGCKDDDKRIDRTRKNESDMISTETKNVQILTEEGIDASEILTEENCNDSQNSPCESAMWTTQCEIRTESSEASNHYSRHNISERECCHTRSNPKDILLRSPSFLSHAEELFDINAYHPIVFQTISLDESGIADTRLLLDCANELLEHKSMKCPVAIHPVLQNPMMKSRICISLDQLTREICDGIENLRSYTNLAADSFPVDTLYAVLERDLCCKGVVSGAWDLGWSNGLTVDEVVGEVEMLLLSGLLEEMLTDHYML